MNKTAPLGPPGPTLGLQQAEDSAFRKNEELRQADLGS